MAAKSTPFLLPKYAFLGTNAAVFPDSNSGDCTGPVV
jgi:hypothetical protein